MTEFLTFTSLKTRLKLHLLSIDNSNYNLINIFSTQLLKL